MRDSSRTIKAQTPLEKFKQLTIAHPLWTSTYENLLQEVREPGDAAMIFFVGPTGVGKTTELKQLYADILREESDKMREDKGYIPIIKVEARATATGKFAIRTFYQDLLIQLREPLINKKTDFSKEESKEKQTRPSGYVNDLRIATEQALENRKVNIVLIDEGQHMTKVKSSKKLDEVLDSIKSLSNMTGVLYVIFGTYELSLTRNLSAQLIRRSVDIHFPRYRYENKEDMENFASIIAHFQNKMPTPETPDLVKHWKYLYTCSMGCVGILKRWMDKALSLALRKKDKTVNIEHFKKTQKTVEQLKKIAKEALEGELEFLGTNQDLGEVEELLGVSKKRAETKKEMEEKKVAAATAEQKPFVRNPVRDAVG